MTTQILNFSDEQLNELVKEIVSTGHVILHDQHGLTQQQYVEVCNRIGNCEHYNYFMNPKDHPEISLVSGQKDDEGKL